MISHERPLTAMKFIVTIRSKNFMKELNRVYLCKIIKSVVTLQLNTVLFTPIQTGY